MYPPFLNDLIKSRQEMIFKNLQEADNKFSEAENSLTTARKNLEVAKDKADQISTQSLVLSQQMTKNFFISIDEDIKRLKNSNISIIRFEEEKSINEVV